MNARPPGRPRPVVPPLRAATATARERSRRWLLLATLALIVGPAMFLGDAYAEGRDLDTPPAVGIGWAALLVVVIALGLAMRSRHR